MASIEEKDERLAKGLAVDDGSYVESIDPAAEKRLVRKLDRHIIPIIMLLYLLSFLDRSVGDLILSHLSSDEAHPHWRLPQRQYR